MKNSFCRICRGRFNLKYPPAAVDSIKKSIHPRTISVLISESGEVSENICWDCEETLLGFHKSIGEDNEEEEPVVVDDDEILYKSLEKSKRIHRLSQKVEVIEIDSSDSDAEELVIIPDDDEVIEVESARTIGECSRKLSGGDKKVRKSVKKKTPQNTMSIQTENPISRGRVFETKQCPLCPYHSGIEHEVVFHIRQTHPHYTGEDLRFDTKIGDSILTRRIIFAHLWTFFECKECGKIYDRFWPHRKHITTHDRKQLKNALESNISKAPTNLPKQIHNNNVKNLKRPLDEINVSNKSDSNNERVKQMKISTDNCLNLNNNKTTVVNLQSESKPKKVDKLKSQNEKSKSKALIRKQQLMQTKRERRRQKQEEAKKAAKKVDNKIKSAPKAKISKPTFKMPTLPAPRASATVKSTKPIVQKLSFICKLCSKVFPGFMGWNSHMLWNHSLDEFKKQKNCIKDACKICDKEFNDSSILENHMRFFHRRKNRKIAMEVNGNDKDEICCQNKMSKSKDVKGVEEMTALNVPSVMPCNESNELPSDGCLAADNALFCQYCGSLVALKDVVAHESNHITEEDVKRFLLKTKPKV